MTAKKIDHIGVIVSDIEKAIEQYRNVLGLRLDRVEEYGQGLLKIAFLPLGELQIELIQPLKPGSSAWEFLKEKGEGIEHIAFRVSDINKELNEIIRKNVPVTDSHPRKGAGDTRIAFLQRDALNGVLGEFVSDQK